MVEIICVISWIFSVRQLNILYPVPEAPGVGRLLFPSLLLLAMQSGLLPLFVSLKLSPKKGPGTLGG